MKTIRYIGNVLLLVGMLLMSLVGVGQNSLTVHDGSTTNSYVPVYGFYTDAYLKCEIVYPASELSDMTGGTIVAMTFYANSPASASWGDANFQVFLKEVDNTTISAFSGTNDAAMVYEGSIDGTVSEITIIFTTPYTYNGGNLLLGIYNTIEGTYKSISWSGETVTGASVQGYSYSSLDAVSPTQRNFIPKTTFEYTPDPSVCQKPNNLIISNITTNSATISWSGNATSYNIRTNCKRYNFDTGFQGWTTIDADSDGYDWVLGSNVGGVYLVNGASLSGDGHNSSIDLVTSGSYENVNTTTLTPDNYLVSPLIQFGSGSKISFWACAQDINWQSEHFGIAISTNGNINPNDFTTIAYCTFPGNMTREQSDWKYYEVDLSTYSGQGYVAIRHFDCSDEFMLNIDDITICENGSIIIENVTSPYTITNLSPETEYTYLIESDCGNGNLSALTSINFTTNSLPQPREQCQVGDNWGISTNSYLPSYSFYNYSLTQQIYTSEEIGAADIIEYLYFYNGGSEKTRAFNIYMKHTSKSSFSSNSDWETVDDATLVWSGSKAMIANDWTEFELSIPFVYNETSNLCLIIDDNTGSYSSGMTCRVYDAPSQAIRIYSDGTNYDPSTPTLYSGAIMNVKNQIKLCNEYGNTLPINLLEFYATPDRLAPTPTNNIYIKTGGEWNNCEYIIYRSQDAMNWDYGNPVIDWNFSDNPHDASANANYSEHSYMEYFPIDHNPYDTTYYKLIQRDCDNTAHEYTSEIIVCINGKQKKSAWDYFAYTHEGLMVSSSDKPITIACCNILGQTIYQTDIPSDDNIVLTLKPPYICVIYCDGEIAATERVLK